MKVRLDKDEMWPDLCLNTDHDCPPNKEHDVPAEMVERFQRASAEYDEATLAIVQYVGGWKNI